MNSCESLSKNTKDCLTVSVESLESSIIGIHEPTGLPMFDPAYFQAYNNVLIVSQYNDFTKQEQFVVLSSSTSNLIPKVRILNNNIYRKRNPVCKDLEQHWDRISGSRLFDSVTVLADRYLVDYNYFMQSTIRINNINFATLPGQLTRVIHKNSRQTGNTTGLFINSEYQLQACSCAIVGIVKDKFIFSKDAQFKINNFPTYAIMARIARLHPFAEAQIKSKLEMCSNRIQI